MFRIYTKEKNSRELFNVNLNAAEVAALMGNNLFLDHPGINPNDCIIVEQEEAFKHPTFVEGIIREKTREELIAEGIAVQLEAGEIIQDKKLVKIPQPSKWHNWNGTEWVANLEEIKKAKIEEFKNIRDEKESANLEVDGFLFQVTFKDLQKFFLKKIEFDLGTATTDNWRLADNTYKEIDFEFIKKILEAYGSRQRAIFTKFGVLEYQINNCNTVEEIESIEWN